MRRIILVISAFAIIAVAYLNLRHHGETLFGYCYVDIDTDAPTSACVYRWQPAPIK